MTRADAASRRPALSAGARSGEVTSGRIAIERAPAEEPDFVSDICDGCAATAVARAHFSRRIE